MTSEDVREGLELDEPSDPMDPVFEAQVCWIEEHLPDGADYNLGWYVDDEDGYVQTKVYGHGVLTTNMDLEHEWEEF